FAAVQAEVQKAVAARRKELPPPLEKLAVLVETDPNPPVPHVLRRGLHNAPAPEGQPGGPAALGTRAPLPIDPPPPARARPWARQFRAAAGLRPLGCRPGEPAVRPGHGQPRLAAPLWRRLGGHAGQPRSIGRPAQPSRAARLPRDGIRAGRLEREEPAPVGS